MKSTLTPAKNSLTQPGHPGMCLSLYYWMVFILIGCLSVSGVSADGTSAGVRNIYDPGPLKPVDSQLKVKLGQVAPDFKMPAVRGGSISLSQFRGKQNVVISFVPAAFTPVCSAQWPGYNLAEDYFKEYDAVLLGVTVDNIPALHAWTQDMGELWFDVLSDFWPHGKVSKEYGILRSGGTSERALFVIDKQGVIRYIDVHDINERPPLDDLISALEKLK